MAQGRPSAAEPPASAAISHLIPSLLPSSSLLPAFLTHFEGIAKGCCFFMARAPYCIRSYGIGVTFEATFGLENAHLEVKACTLIGDYSVV